VAICKHIPDDLAPPLPGAMGCEDCLAMNQRNWVHLRLCQTCGHVGCCDNSPGTHATAHFHASQHPLIRSFEPGEDWWWCYPDEKGFFVDGSPPAPSYENG
jgi:uncharacterized UBP type Zn finger protein